jgi:hypothetical protein
MSTYLLAITPEPIPEADWAKVFSHLVACNPTYNGVKWNGVVNVAAVKHYSLWTTMMQMNDAAVADDRQLTVVWAPDPLDERMDFEHRFFELIRPSLHRIIDEWTQELGGQRPEGILYGGHVAWLLEDVDTGLLAEDFAGARRRDLQVVPGRQED